MKGDGTGPGRPVAHCLNCGEEVGGCAYCPRCGQRAVELRTGVRELAREALATVASLDSKALRTAWALYMRPGVVAAEYLAGRRVRWVSPIKLFLVAAALYVFVGAPYAQKLASGAEMEALGRTGQAVVLEEASPEAREQAERDTAAALAAVERSMPILLRAAFVGSAPAVVLLFALVEAGRRRPLYDHAVVGLYFLGLVAGFQLLDQPVALAARNLLGWSPLRAHLAANAVVNLVLLATTTVWLRRIYGDRTWVAILKALVVMIGLELSVVLLAGVSGLALALGRWG